jgi:hypothetical protein
VSNDLGRSVVLEKVEDLRKASGDVMSHQVNWNPLSWKRQGLEMFKPQISKFASECRQVKIQHVISRQDVLTLSESFEDVFIGAMIFGYGPVGYGPFRIGRVINENPDLLEKLKGQYFAAGNSPRESWESHTQSNRIKYLGPAFATKFAYFAARRQRSKGTVPLIADINTSSAMSSLAGIPRSVEKSERYLEYVDLAHTWGADIGGGYGVDEVERAVFKIGANIRDQMRKSNK